MTKYAAAYKWMESVLKDNRCCLTWTGPFNYIPYSYNW
jgi:hypothetical protein